MIRVKASELYRGRDVIEKIGNTSFPAKKSYLVSKFIKKFNDEFQLIDKKRGELVEELGVPESGQMNKFKIPREKEKEYYTKLEEILDIDVEIESKKLKFEDILMDSSGQEIGFSPNEMAALESFIEFEEEKEESKEE